MHPVFKETCYLCCGSRTASHDYYVDYILIWSLSETEANLAAGKCSHFLTFWRGRIRHNVPAGDVLAELKYPVQLLVNCWLLLSTPNSQMSTGGTNTTASPGLPLLEGQHMYRTPLLKTGVYKGTSHFKTCSACSSFSWISFKLTTKT